MHFASIMVYSIYLQELTGPCQPDKLGSNVKEGLQQKSKSILTNHFALKSELLIWVQIKRCLLEYPGLNIDHIFTCCTYQCSSSVSAIRVERWCAGGLARGTREPFLSVSSSLALSSFSSFQSAAVSRAEGQWNVNLSGCAPFYCALH